MIEACNIHLRNNHLGGKILCLRRYLFSSPLASSAPIWYKSMLLKCCFYCELVKGITHPKKSILNNRDLL